MQLGRDKQVGKLVQRLVQGGVVKASGVWGSFAPMLASYISKKTKRPILYLCPHIDDADKALDDIETFAGRTVELLPAWEAEELAADATDEIRTQRLRVAMKLASRTDNFIMSASVQAICQPICKLDHLKDNCLKIHRGKILSPELLSGWLVDNGFERVDRVDLPGQFARRGGIIDIYAPLIDSEQGDIVEQGAEAALRVEFFDEVVDGIRKINLDTQLSSEQIDNVGIVSVMGGEDKNGDELFLNTLPTDTLIILEEPLAIQETAEVFLHRSESVENLYIWPAIYESLKGFAQLHLSRFAESHQHETINFDIKSVQPYQHKAGSLWSGKKEVLNELVTDAKKGWKIHFYCESSAERKRIKEILQDEGSEIPANFKLLDGFVHQGFIVNALKTIVISHHELFGQFTIRRRQRTIRPASPINTLAELQKGDYVVHISYGIGKFLGVKTIKEKDSRAEYLAIEYADKVKVHVSVNNIDLVQKYIGTSPKRPQLSKIGSKKWQSQKEKAARAIQNLASELLEVQAKRKAVGGIKFEKDSKWQNEFEQAFAYQETADQIISVAQIKADMQQPTAMDRLLCGDVGYGKTELSMRAAFKAVENGKQVAVLVPTTVLSVQHSRTFTERFADFPICVEVLNRFKTSKQSADIIARTKAGKIDILIGTHRLLSGDVGFKDLGLLVIDEEQRFGVAAKEKLKKFRFNVDVLTMTATPIPRTLHMALLGLRDISSLASPPMDRRSVVTSVASYNQQLIKKAVLCELNRQGQIFFVHNRVKSIEKKAFELSKLLKDTGVRITIAHGQMSKKELERAMIDFVTGKVDMLVCTTIIEAGLDIPNANTIFIDNADRYGLAQLHQLRGRVGRFKHRAFAYMFLPSSRSITPIAAKRLKAIEDYSHLGAGFRIALRDLEIRGAGNLLGSEQSGHIQVVGYQMYCDMLAEAVGKIKGEKTKKKTSVVLDLGFSVYIPKDYIPADRLRLDIYRKIAVAVNEDDIDKIKNELVDVYGKLPGEVVILLQLAAIRIAAGRRGIKSIVVAGKNLVFSFAGGAKISSDLFSSVAAKISITDSKTVYLRMEKNYFTPDTLMAILRKILM